MREHYKCHRFTPAYYQDVEFRNSYHPRQYKRVSIDYVTAGVAYHGVRNLEYMERSF